jgi:hypothetical protein
LEGRPSGEVNLNPFVAGRLRVSVAGSHFSRSQTKV